MSIEESDNKPDNITSNLLNQEANKDLRDSTAGLDKPKSRFGASNKK